MGKRQLFDIKVTTQKKVFFKKNITCAISFCKPFDNIYTLSMSQHKLVKMFSELTSVDIL